MGTFSRGIAPRFRLAQVVALWAVTALLGCDTKKHSVTRVDDQPDEGALCRAGNVTVYQRDLDRELQERHIKSADPAAKRKVLDDLAARAQFVQAALDAKLDRDPAVRAEFARILTSRLKEEKLLPQLKSMTTKIPPERLRELYQANLSRFVVPEKRQAAVLWLNPGNDPARTKQYEEKLAAAREWLMTNAEVKDHPEKGFSVLSVDSSEHASTRYKGGVVGWLEKAGGMDPWSKAVAEILFSLKERGEVSQVTTRPEGVFLVRYMAYQPSVQRTFEAVSAELERAERQRLRAAAEAEFESGIKASHPVEWLTK